MVSSEATGRLTREELVARAEALLPAIKARAAETEEMRHVHPDTVRDLREAGLLRVPNPKRFGGYDSDIDLMFELATIIGRACGSSAWCFSVWGIHNWMVGHWPEQGQVDYFGEDGNTLSSSSFAPNGRLTPVEGGFRMSGRWEFSSGSDAASWALLGAMGPQGPLFTLVPRPDYEIIDTWFVSGLRGTGSKDIQVNDAFVPTHRTIPFMGMGPSSPAFAMHGRDSYRLPAMAILPFTLCSPIVGMAQGAVDELVGRLKGKTGPGRTSESVALQLRIAESSAEVDAARLLVLTNSRSAIERAGRGEMPDELQQATIRRSFGFATKLCVQAVNRLFDGSGGHSLFTSDPMQRYHRDVHAGSHQAALSWDSIGEAYGRAALGLPPAQNSR